MIWKDQVFVVNVVVIAPTWEMMASSVISWLVGVVEELRTIVKIRKGHCFISIVMEVHGSAIWIILLSVPIFSTIDDQEVIYPCFFAFNFSSNILILLLACFNLCYKEENCVGEWCLL
jgi:hypothetical protein